MECKAEFKFDRKKMELEGYASIFGNVDAGNDRIIAGAFTNTINQRFVARKAAGKHPAIKVLYQHNDPMGMPIHMEEDSKGLFTVSKISNTPTNMERMSYIEDGVVDGMSIGYDPIRADFEQLGDERIRNLREIKLWEYSPVTWGMNNQAEITGVKALFADLQMKAGRVLSAKNETEIKNAMTEMQTALKHLQEVLNGITKEPAKSAIPEEIENDPALVQSAFDLIERTKRLFG